MKLLMTHASPFARKVRVVADEVGASADIEIVEIGQATIPTNRIEEVSAASPLGKIPTLILDDGTTLVDSHVIAEYLDLTYHGALFPADGSRWEALTLQAVSDGIIEAGIAVRLEGLRPQDRRWSEWTEAHRAKIRDALDWTEKMAPLNARLDIGQITLACAIDWLIFRDVEADPLAGRPRLADWHENMCGRKSLRASAPRL